MAEKKYFKVNVEKKTITIDTTVTPIAAEERAVDSYVKAGYIIKFKSEKRAAAARKRATESGFGKKKENK